MENVIKIKFGEETYDVLIWSDIIIVKSETSELLNWDFIDVMKENCIGIVDMVSHLLSTIWGGDIYGGFKNRDEQVANLWHHLEKIKEDSGIDDIEFIEKDIINWVIGNNAFFYNDRIYYLEYCENSDHTFIMCGENENMVCVGWAFGCLNNTNNDDIIIDIINNKKGI